jgi:subtilisin family serine protease
MRKPDLPTSLSWADEPYADVTAMTGRYMVVFRDGRFDKGIEMLESFGLRVARSPESGESVMKEDEVGNVDVIVFRQLGVAVVAAEAEQINQLANAVNDASSPIQAIEPERVRRITGDKEPFSRKEKVFTSKTRIALHQLIDDLDYSDGLNLGIARAAAFDESQATWGLQITNTLNSQFSGRGIRVAILDTGIDLRIDGDGNIQFHPDFEGRTIVAKTFVPGTTTAKDLDGHGTHCLGIACGPLRALPRYGIAYDSEIYVAKVVDDTGNSPDGWVTAAIEWAMSTGCQIISLSIGNKKAIGQPYSVTYENIALRALNAGVLIIAAAGNCFDDDPCPVKEPADCPSVMAVGSITEEYKVASFSCIGINLRGGEVDIVAPGAHVYSSYLRPLEHTRASGTSAATPHVAGIAALYAEANPGVVGKALWDLLIKPGNVYRLPFSSTYVGAGLVQAPLR